MSYYGMYETTNSHDTRCGICHYWIKGGQHGVAIYTGGTYGHLCHIICAIAQTQWNLEHLKELFDHSGKRADRFRTPDGRIKPRLIGL